MGSNPDEETWNANDVGDTAFDKSLLNRRGYLKMGAAAAGVVGLGSASVGSAAGQSGPERHGIQFDRTVDAVDDLGMDPTGSQAVDGQFDFENGTLIKFPPGTYRFTQRHDGFDVTNFGLLGTGDSREDVRFVGPDGEPHTLLNIRSGKNVLIENLTFDQGEDHDGSIGNNLIVQDNLQLRKLRHKGYEPAEKGAGGAGNRTNMVLLVENSSGNALVKDYDMRMSGYQHVEYPGNAAAIWSGPTHTGTVTYQNLQIENCGGIYASRTVGEVRIESSSFKNIDNAAVRICGEGSYIKNSRIEIDTDSAPTTHDFNYAVRWESGFQGKSGGVIENCEFVCRSVEKPVPLIDHDGSAGALTVRNTSFLIEADGVGVLRSTQPGSAGSIDGTPDKPWDVTFEGCDVSGSISASDPVVKIAHRDGSTVQNSCLDVGGDMDGVAILDSNNCAIADTNINVGGQATVFKNSSVATTNLTHSDTCSIDDSGSSGGSDGSTSDGSSDEPSTSLSNTLEITGRSGTVSEYSVTVSEAIEGDGSLNSEDSISGTTAEGAVAGGSDGYGFDGEITDFSHTNEVTVWVNGSEVDPSTLGSGSSSGGSDGSTSDGSNDSTDGSNSDGSSGDSSTSLSNTLEITGRSGTVSEYSVTVSEAIEGDGSLNSEDSISGTTAEGAVAGGSDGYRFAGDITDFSHTNEVTVWVNGSEVDPSTLGSGSSGGSDGSNDSTDGSTSDGSNSDGSSGDSSTSLSNTLEIVGVAGSVSDYTVTVSEAIEGDGSLNSEDSVSGTTATGAVAGGGDGYRYAGEITGFTHDGPVTVYRNGEQVDPETLGTSDDTSLPNRIVLDGVDSGTCEYNFTASGSVEKSADFGSIEADDTVSGGQVTGTVADDIDAYYFSGEITSLAIDGGASVEFEYGN